MITPTTKMEMAFGAGVLDPTSRLTFTTNSSTSYAEATYASYQDITPVDVRVRAKIDWPSSQLQTLAGKWLTSGAATGRSWFMYCQSGSITFTVNDTAGSTASLTFTPNVQFVTLTEQWLRCTVEQVDAKNVKLTIWTSKTGLVWTPQTTLTTATFVGLQVAASTPVTLGNQHATSSTFNSNTGIRTGGSISAFELWNFTTKLNVMKLDLDEPWTATDLTWTSTSANLDAWTRAAATTIATTWTDVTADLLHDAGVSTSYGRSSDLDRFQTGSMSFSLRNDTRKYDPDYASGTYYGKLLPKTPVRLRVKYSSVVYPIHRGYVSSGFPQKYDPSNNWSYVPLSSGDAFSIMSNVQAPVNSWTSEMARSGTPLAWWRLDSQDNIRDLSGNGFSLGVFGLPSFGTPAMAGSTDQRLQFGDIQFCNRLAPVFATTAATKTVEAWIKSTAPQDYSTVFTQRAEVLCLRTADGLIVYECYVDGQGIALNYRGAAYTYRINLGSDSKSAMRILDGNPHHLVWVISSAGSPYVTAYVDGVVVPTVSTTISGTIGGTAAETTAIGYPVSSPTVPTTIDEVVVWNGALDPAVIASHYTAGRYARSAELSSDRIAFMLDSMGWQSDLVNLDVGTTQVQAYGGGGGSILDYCQTVEQTEQGQFFIDGRGFVRFRNRSANWSTTRSLTSQFTLSDDGSDTRYLASNVDVQFDDKLLFNQAALSRDGGQTVIVQDDTSVQLYGAKAYTASGMLFTSDAQVKGVADAIVWFHKDIAAYIDSISMYPENVPATIYPQVLGRLIGDRITVERTPQGVGSQIVRAVLVDMIEHHFDSAQWVTTFSLNTQAVKSNFFQWGTSNWGGSDVWSF